MDVGKGDELSPRFEDTHHFVQKLPLQGLRKGCPRQSGDNAVHGLHACSVAYRADIRHGILSQPDAWETGAEHLRKFRIQFDCREFRARLETPKDDICKHPGPGPVFQNVLGLLEIEVIDNRLSQKR